jgi:hypothetical protein
LKMNFKRRKWNEKGYDISNNNTYEIREGKGIIKEYDYLFGNLYLKVNIKLEKEMEMKTI